MAKVQEDHLSLVVLLSPSSQSLRRYFECAVPLLHFMSRYAIKPWFSFRYRGQLSSSSFSDMVISNSGWCSPHSLNSDIVIDLTSLNTSGLMAEVPIDAALAEIITSVSIDGDMTDVSTDTISADIITSSDMIDADGDKAEERTDAEDIETEISPDDTEGDILADDTVAVTPLIETGPRAIAGFTADESADANSPEVIWSNIRDGFTELELMLAVSALTV